MMSCRYAIADNARSGNLSYSIFNPAIAVVPRFLTSLIAPDQAPYGKAVWGDTALVLPPDLKGHWHDALNQSKAPGSAARAN